MERKKKSHQECTLCDLLLQRPAGMLQVTEELLSPRGSAHCTQMIKGTSSALRSNALVVQAR